ncbi:MAG: type II secretion system F family protein [Gammaproteobacteria bacterium]|nr:type II secretion system F family protein [Gammaproteobacteria bacterium]
MPKYLYNGRTQAGEAVQGSLDASAVDSAANMLIQNGVFPISIELHIEKPDAWKDIKRKMGWDLPSDDDIILFSRQCHAIQKAGIPIIRGFRLLAESARNPRFAETISQVADDLETGRELSTSMARHPKTFGPLYINMIRVGETTGRLEDVFLQMHDYLESDRETLRQIKQALRYPMFVMMTMAVAFVIVMTFVIPKFAGFYGANGLELPLPTKIIMGISGFMVNYWWLMLLTIISAVVSFKRHIETDEGLLWWDKTKLQFPKIGDIVLRATLARFARTLALALNAGVPILQAITVTAYAVGNEYISRKIIAMRDAIERGEPITRTARKSGVFTGLALQMLAVGEETGRLDDMLKEVSGFYEREVEYDVKHINSLIEPILVICMAALVLLLMLGILLPMWNVVDMVKK